MKTVLTIIIFLISFVLDMLINAPDDMSVSSFDSFGRVVAFLIVLAATGLALYFVHRDSSSSK